ncbi:MAG TPA: alginate lyase family protein [Tepidisphaeraceae bacterium]|jgi:hypothetical protein
MFRIVVLLCFLIISISRFAVAQNQPAMNFDIKQIERDRGVIKAADGFLADQPITVTASKNPRSAGGLHDFSSEGDYWWPDPAKPDGPYIQKDGMTNPDNFVEHRHAMIRMSIHVAAVTSAYRITGEDKYAQAAIKHLHAWLVDPQTLMNPNLQYAQAIKGVSTGRGIGIIDTVHLIEVARSAQLLEKAGQLKGEDLAATKKWFADYLNWMTTSKNGNDEMNAANNHGTCFAMQVAAFASFVGDQKLLEMVRQRYKEVLLPKQMADDGSFPQELRRTKPYGYSIFNADAMATLCWIASSPQDNLWEFTTPDGKNFRKAVEYIHPFIKDKSTWPLKPDVMFWEFWPVRSPVLLFGGLAYHEPKFLETWKSLEANPTNEEVIRNLPIRYPVLWVE